MEERISCTNSDLSPGADCGNIAFDHTVVQGSPAFAHLITGKASN